MNNQVYVVICNRGSFIGKVEARPEPGTDFIMEDVFGVNLIQKTFQPMPVKAIRFHLGSEETVMTFQVKEGDELYTAYKEATQQASLNRSGIVRPDGGGH